MVEEALTSPEERVSTPLALRESTETEEVAPRAREEVAR
jgi:hypothetical protein